MNIQTTLARKLLKWRDENLTSTIPENLLTPDELAEGLRLHWVESELMEQRHITYYTGRLEEMGDAAKQVVQGDTVTIGENGESFQATVSEVTPQGVKLSFKDRAPRDPNRIYQHTELNPVGTTKVNLAPNSTPVDPADDRGRHGMFRLAMGFMGGASTGGTASP